MAESLTPPLHKDPGKQGRRRSHPPVRCKDLGSLSEADKATEAVSPTLLALHQCHQMARLRIERRSPQMSQPPSIKSILLQVQLRWAGHVTRTEDVRMLKAVFSKLQERERNRGAPRKHNKDQLKRKLAQAGISHQSWQQKASDRDS